MQKSKLEKAERKLSKMRPYSSQYLDQYNRIHNFESTGYFAMGSKKK